MRRQLLGPVVLAMAWLLGAPPLAAAQPVSRLAAVLGSGELRVCTTGDYPPYSLRAADGEYRGVDIALAADFAAALHVRTRWVPVTWSALADEFAARCDIAVGGISDTATRRRVADFSVPVVVDGKVPVVRRRDGAEYSTIARIDRPGVRVIVNRGGANEAFARTRFPHAHLIVWPDNLTICDQLADGNADVFVTDSIEGRYRQRDHPGLAVLHPDRPFDSAAKAFMLPHGDLPFAAAVDAWLETEIRTGRTTALLDSWLR